jgi:hypothetical protein
LKKNISPVGVTGQEHTDIPIQVSVDREHIMYGQMNAGQMSSKIAIYYPHENKYTFSENVSKNEENSMITFEGYQKDFFSDIWKKYLERLPVDFEAFYVQSLIFDMHFFNEALFFYLYGAFKFRSLQFFKDNFNIVQPDFFWEDPVKAEHYFKNRGSLEANEESEPEHPSDAEMPDLGLTLEDPLGSDLERLSSNEDEIPRLPSGIEESEDEMVPQVLNVGGFQRPDFQKDQQYIKINKDEAYSFERYIKPNQQMEDIGDNKNNLLKDKFSVIEEESQHFDVSQKTSRTESQVNIARRSKVGGSANLIFGKNSEGSFGNNLQTTVDTEKKSEQGRRVEYPGKITSMGEYTRFRKKSGQEYEEVNNVQYSSSERNLKERQQQGLVSKSLNIVPKKVKEEETEENMRVEDINNDFSQSERTESTYEDMIAINQDKVKNSFNLDVDVDEYESDFNRSSNFGFNKYMQSSSKVVSSKNEVKSQTFELETGRMSQSHASEVNSRKEISNDYGLRDSLPRKGNYFNILM